MHVPPKTPVVFTSVQQRWQQLPLQTASLCSLPNTSAPSGPCRPRGPRFSPRARAGALGESSWSPLAAGTASEVEGESVKTEILK